MRVVPFMKAPSREARRVQEKVVLAVGSGWQGEVAVVRRFAGGVACHLPREDDEY